MRNVLSKGVIVKIIFSCLIIWLSLLRKRQVRNYQCFIPNKEPKIIWNFVADFSNVPKLNKRIRSWQLLSEEGNLHRWRYRIISYESMLGEVLFGLNENHGEITVETIIPSKHFTIKESYKTFSFRKMLTIDNWTKTDFRKFKKAGQSGTLFEEEVVMECPIIFLFICSLETDKNREDFIDNLRRTFS